MNTKHFEQIQALENLKQYYLSNLCEDGQDGSWLDCKVLDFCNGLISDIEKMRV